LAEGNTEETAAVGGQATGVLVGWARKEARQRMEWKVEV